MTVLVGVRCIDGVVVGADSMATSSMGPQHLIQITSDDKINIVDSKIIIACTGSVGLSQRFHAIVKEAWQPKKLFQKSAIECTREIARNAVQDFGNTGVPRHQHLGLQFGSLMAAPLDGIAQLIEFSAVDFQPEIKRDKIHFVSMGSGQLLADPFLAFISRVLWQDKAPDVKTAAFGVFWVLTHAIKYAPGGLGLPIKLATLKKEKGDWIARSMEGDELQECAQHVSEIEKRIGSYPREIIEGALATPPPKPPSETDS